MKNKATTILIVDDHQLVVDGIKSMLSSSQPGFIVAGEASNGQMALDMIETNPEKYRLVITDITMPLMSGTELCKIIKQEFPFIKVLILSMHNSFNIIKEALNAEADGYLLKNTGKDDFLFALNRIVNDGTYFSQDIIPVISGLMRKERSGLPKNDLTQREKEVLELIVQELTSKEIADKLYISKQTVDTHRINIMQKTGCRTLVGLIKYAVRTGVV